jgi:hypothetical protein
MSEPRKWKRKRKPATCRALFEACQFHAVRFDEIFTTWEAQHREALKVADAGELAGELWGFESNFIDVLLWEQNDARIENDGNLRDFHRFLCFHVERTQKLIDRLSARQCRANHDGQPGEQWLSQIFQPLVNYQFEMEYLSKEIDSRIRFVLNPPPEAFPKKPKDIADDLTIPLSTVRERLKRGEYERLINRGECQGHWQWHNQEDYEKAKEVVKKLARTSLKEG